MKLPSTAVVLLGMTLSLPCLYGQVSFSYIGDHPTSPQTAWPAINSLQAHEGRIYMGYGQNGAEAAVFMAGYDPSDRLFHLEHAVGSDAVDTMRPVNGLFVPHINPANYEDFSFYSWKTNAGWSERTPANWQAVYDIAQASDGKLFVVGRDENRHGQIAYSTTSATWSTIPAAFYDGNPYQWCFELNDVLYCQKGSTPMGNINYVGSPTFTDYPILYHPTKVKPASGPSFVVTLANRIQGESYQGKATSLLSFDGVSLRVLRTQVRAFATFGDEISILDGEGKLLVATATTPEQLNFTAVTSDAPSNAYSLAATAEGWYVGTVEGKLYGARRDAAMVPASVGVSNELPAEHSRALVMDQNRVVIGSPNATVAGTPTAGSLTFSTEPEGGSVLWPAGVTIPSPSPQVSGWFARDIALRGNLMAVLATGMDISNVLRGSQSTVFLYRQNATSNVWELATSVMVPFSHSVGISPTGNKLVVGTANSADPAATPSLAVFTINQPFGVLPTLTTQAHLIPTTLAGRVKSWGTRPVARVAFIHDWVIGAFSGDPSINGGNGTLLGWQENAGDRTSYKPAPAWAFRSSKRFGYSLAAEGDWIVTGCPANDGTSKNTGSFYMFRKSATGSPVYTGGYQIEVAGAEYGRSIAVGGNTMLVGAPFRLGDAEQPVGEVAELRLNAGGEWRIQKYWTPPAHSLRGFGISVAVGDLWLAMGCRATVTASPAINSVSFQPRADAGTALEKWWKSMQPSAALPDLNSDADGDGYSLIQEYAWHLDPLKPDPPQNPAKVSGSGICFPASPDLRVRFQAFGSEDLQSWSTSTLPIEQIIDSNGAPCWRQPFPESSRRFFSIVTSYQR